MTTDADAALPLVLRDLPIDEMTAAVAPLGVSDEVARRLFARVHREGRTDLDGLAGLTAGARERLRGVVAWPDLSIVERRRSADGFVKYLFRLPDDRLVEAVRIPLPDPAAARALKERRRAGLAAPLEALPAAKYTLCVSSQVGCALACDFCATGRLGGIRNLSTWEILAQHRLVAAEADHPIRGVVFMGMGEPFLNYDNVIRAARVLSHPAGAAISGKAISISTAGVVPIIQRFTREGHPFRLLVSLSSAIPEVRAQLMPIERRWPLPQLMEAVRAYADATKDRVTLAYVAIRDTNMSAEAATALADLVEGLRVKINLIDVNDATGRYAPPTSDELQTFRNVLAARRIPVVRRYSGGSDIGASCGRLAASQTGGELLALSAPRAPAHMPSGTS